MRKVVLAVAVVVAAVVLVLVLWPRHAADGDVPPGGAERRDATREPAAAGPVGYYPDDPGVLRPMCRRFVEAAEIPELPGRIVGLMAPHAGYRFSGAVAGAAYAALRGQPCDTVILVGPSHGSPVDGAALSAAKAWRTPLGLVPVDAELTESLARNDGIHTSDLPHLKEHSLEAQLPFLQVVLSDSASREQAGFRIAAAVMSDFSAENCDRIGAAIATAVAARPEKHVLLVASSDMSHYPPYETANRVDRATLAAIESLDPARVLVNEEERVAEDPARVACALCGLGPVAVVMQAARALGADKAVVLDYANSGDVPIGDRTGCVGYGAVAFCEADATPASEPGQGGQADEAASLTAEQQRVLLRLARDTIRAFLEKGDRLPAKSDDEALNRVQGCFVTLEKDGDLRGCIGAIVARKPLVENVRDMAIAAATEDRRFPPVKADELGEIEIEVSVLSPLRRVDDASDIVVGRHGVVVKQEHRQGVFLPQVAVENGWDRDTMLTVLCAEKAGLPPDAWRRGAELYVFTTQAFGE